MILDDRKWQLRTGIGNNLLRFGFFQKGNSVVESDIDIADGNNMVLDVVLPSPDGDQAANFQVCFAIQLEIQVTLRRKLPT